jgi:predicted RecB family nuclease
MTKPLLSKSRFLAGLQCPLRLWYSCFEPNLASETTPAQQALFDTGHQVGELARDRYPQGKLIDEDHHKLTEAIQATHEVLKTSSTPAIYEATFAYDDVLIRADILERAGDGAWNLIEVKSGIGVKDYHVHDVAIQHYVLSGVGFELEQAGILNLNNEYVYDGRKLDLEALFTFEDLGDKVAGKREEIATEVQRLKAMLERTEPPAIDPSRHCRSPYDCEFFDHCRKSMPEHWVMQLSGIRKERLDELAEMGINDIRDVPESFSLSALQARIRQCVIRDADYLSSELKSDLKEYEYPIHFLDFETIAPAIPRYANTRPYQVLPFQWSDHILSKDGTLTRKEYLCNEDKDPREELAESLLEVLGDKGDICTYGNYEKRVISELAKYLLHYRERLEAVHHRCKDLLGRIRKGYYHPDFHGSFSLKNVLPALVPSMSYEALPIQEGSMAGLEYLRMIDPNTSSDEKERIRKDLLKYCGQDTLAMVKIREELLKRCSDRGSDFKIEFLATSKR